MADRINLNAFEETFGFGGGILLNRSGWAPMPALETNNTAIAVAQGGWNVMQAFQKMQRGAGSRVGLRFWMVMPSGLSTAGLVKAVDGILGRFAIGTGVRACCSPSDVRKRRPEALARVEFL
jgi:hypothetical protein